MTQIRLNSPLQCEYLQISGLLPAAQAPMGNPGLSLLEHPLSERQKPLQVAQCLFPADVSHGFPAREKKVRDGAWSRFSGNAVPTLGFGSIRMITEGTG